MQQKRASNGTLIEILVFLLHLMMKLEIKYRYHHYQCHFAVTRLGFRYVYVLNMLGSKYGGVFIRTIPSRMIRISA